MKRLSASSWLQARDTANVVVWLVPNSAYPFLDYSLPSFFKRERAARRHLRPLYLRGLTQIGDLVCLDARALFAMLGKDVAAVEAIEARLADVGLRLGMCAPHWTGSRKLLRAG